jgi:hypothetical protein
VALLSSYLALIGSYFMSQGENIRILSAMKWVKWRRMGTWKNGQGEIKGEGRERIHIFCVTH